MNLGESEETYEVRVGDATFVGRDLTSSEAAHLQKRYTTMKTSRGRPYEETDNLALAAEIWRRRIVSWSDVHRSGQPLICDEEGKRWIWEVHVDLAGDVLEALDRAKAAARGGLEKN